MKTFNELGLSDKWVKALALRGITEPTEIQDRAIPILLDKPTDFIGLAQTGTGKTAAYGLPLMAMCPEKRGSTRYLVVSPTRELAMQIATELERFAEGVKGLEVLAVYGGAPIVNQLRSLKRNQPHILVATPGRLLDLLKRKAVAIDEVEAVILDEADEMLNMGFKEDVHEILTYTGSERKIWMFSATMPPAIRNIADTFMRNPQVVTVDAGQKTNKNIIHQYCVVNRNERTPALKRILDFNPDIYGLVFCRTRKDTQEVADDLSRSGYRAEALHGELSQAQRERVMNQFKSKVINLVVATDVAARGIDVEDLTHVIHHGMPQDIESFAHRSGRTARAGKSGISVALIGRNDLRTYARIEKTLNFKSIEVDVPTVGDVRDQQLNVWADALLETKVLKKKIAAVQSVADKLAELSKEEIIDRLLAQQIEQIDASVEKIRPATKQRDSGSRDSKRERTFGKRDSFDKGSRKDSGKRSDPRKTERSPRASKARPGDGDRYFINVGTMDGLDPGTLADFVADQANVSKGQIDRVTVKDRFAFFDVKGGKGGSIEKHFDGLMVNGRKLRVNRDQE